MHLTRWATTGLALVLMGSGWASRPARAQQEPPPPGYYGGQNDWEIPPQEFSDLQRRGFHDGIKGARKDRGNHRRFDVENRDEYRNPDMPPEMREAYRDGFRRGYEMAARHLEGEMEPPVERPWDAVPEEFSEMQQRGFRDGIVGAQRDWNNHRRPDVNNRDEYRDPHVPGEFRDAYRDGFRAGYDAGVRHLMGDAGPAPVERPWDAMPDEFNDVQQQGFRDGMTGAQRDYDNHRQPDVNNRDEYRHPHVPYELENAYREGFRRGYDRAMAHLLGQQMPY